MRTAVTTRWRGGNARDTLSSMAPIPLKARCLLLVGVWLGVFARVSPAQAPKATPAQTPTSTSRPDALWRCELPGGVYLVALRSIVSISSHEYLVDGAARVTEVTVATASTVEARFYFLEPLASNTPAQATLEQLQQRVQDLSSSHGAPADAVWQKVVKTYPTTTHAHTVEFRLASKGDLQTLYQSVEQSWTTGKGVNFKIE